MTREREKLEKDKRIQQHLILSAHILYILSQTEQLIQSQSDAVVPLVSTLSRRCTIQYETSAQVETTTTPL